MLKIFLVYLIAVSILAVVLTIYDKFAAKKHGFRISEATLMLCGVFFGAVAELITMLIIRHKTRHIKFMLGLPLIILFQLAAIAAYLYFSGGFYA